MHHFVGSCDPRDPTCVCSKNPVNPNVEDCVSYAANRGAVQVRSN